MSSSLDSLVNNLAMGGHDFWGFEKCNDRQRELLIRKGIYPYEYMDNWDRFEETSLPRIEKFYSNLNMSGVSDVTTNTLAGFGKNLELEIWENTTTYT